MPTSNLQKVHLFNLCSNYLENPDYSKFVPMPSLSHLSLSLNSLTLDFPPSVLKCINLTISTEPRMS